MDIRGVVKQIFSTSLLRLKIKKFDTQSLKFHKKIGQACENLNIVSFIIT